MMHLGTDKANHFKIWWIRSLW